MQKRAWRARKRGDPSAPAKKKTGPPKGSIRVMNCPTCSLQYPTGKKRATPALPFGDTEFIRRRLQWVSRKLCDELGAQESAVIVTMQAVLADDISRPRMLAAQADAKAGGSIHVYLRPDGPNGK